MAANHFSSTSAPFMTSSEDDGFEPLLNFDTKDLKNEQERLKNLRLEFANLNRLTKAFYPNYVAKLQEEIDILAALIQRATAPVFQAPRIPLREPLPPQPQQLFEHEPERPHLTPTGFNRTRNAENEEKIRQEMTVIENYVAALSSALLPVEELLKDYDAVIQQLAESDQRLAKLNEKLHQTNNYLKDLKQPQQEDRPFYIKRVNKRDKSITSIPLYSDEEFDRLNALKPISQNYKKSFVILQLEKHIQDLSIEIENEIDRDSELKSRKEKILTLENNGIKFSSFKTLLQAKSTIREGMIRGIRVRHDFLEIKPSKDKTQPPKNSGLNQIPPAIQIGMNGNPIEFLGLNVD